MEFESGWDDYSYEVPQKKKNKMSDFFIRVNDKTPEEEKTVEGIFLDAIPVVVPRHHFRDPRVYNQTKNEQGKWGYFHTCVSKNNEYPYCVGCKAENIFDIQSMLLVRGYLSFFSLQKWTDKEGKEHVTGARLFPMTNDTKKTLNNLIQIEKRKNPDFSLVGAKISCYRASAKKETVGNSFSYIEHVDLQELASQYGEEKVKPFNYNEIFAPSSMRDMMADYNAVCSHANGGRDFFDFKEDYDLSDEDRNVEAIPF